MQQAPLGRILKWSLKVWFFVKYFISGRKFDSGRQKQTVIVFILNHMDNK